MIGVVAAAPTLVAAAELEILQPLERTAYQTNEWIDLAVVRRAPRPLNSGTLLLKVVGSEGSKLSFTFSVPAAAVKDSEARRTEHLHLCGWLLRPGHYMVEVTADRATAATELDVYSHVRKSSFRLICWGRAKGQQQLVEGEDSLGFNLFSGHYGRDDEANFIRAGVDFMSCCTMSGGHQMDLRGECDWSDPYVTRGGTRRVTHRALVDRTRPNVFGVHFYDEPGLTWHKHPVTGEWTPHGLPSQVRSYRSAFGRDPIPYHEVKPDNPEHVARWRHWALWKLGFMDAAWKEAQFGVSYVRPDYLSVTQSQYGFSAFTDGYYFNVARCLPVVSGHGGYDDYGCGYFNPSYFLEVARARDFTKPCWYLPTWYGSTPSERFRLEQYLSFMTNVQGMITPPDIDPFEPANKPAAAGVVESNKLMARLGTIFTTMPVTRPPVAMLYSISHNIHAQTRDMKSNYAHSNKQGLALPIEGAVHLGEIPDLPEAKLAKKLHAEGKHQEAAPYETVGKLFENAAPLAEAMKKHLGRAGIQPVFACDQPQIVATRQATEDVEYLFAVNATYDPVAGGRNDVRAATATISLKADGRPVYDAVRGGPVAALKPESGRLVGRFRFGPGQMRVFARTTRPIGSVQARKPVLTCDYTRAEVPLSVAVGGMVLDDQGRVLTGSIPMQVRLIDPLGKTRYDLYRATKDGVLSLGLPLAANDPPGTWSVVIRELLTNKEDMTSFNFTARSQCGALAGATSRAVAFGNDRDNVFRFFRMHHDVTIVTGASDHNKLAARRLTEILRPWGVRCRTVPADDVNRPRTLSEQEAVTWVGLDFGRAKPGAENSVGKVGFDIQGPVLLLGTPQDNPLIELIQKRRFLPYQPTAESFPGRGRGMLAWQRDAVGAGQESITLIAYDEAGMNEAVGTLYEAAAGIQPLTRRVLPSKNSIAPATQADISRHLVEAWRLALPDRAVAMKIGDNGRLHVLTWDGSLVQVDARGQVVAEQVVPATQMQNVAARLQSAPDPAGMEIAEKHVVVSRIIKTVAAHNDLVAVAYWGGTLRLLDKNGDVRGRRLLPQDITGLAWLDGRLVVGLADGHWWR